MLTETAKAMNEESRGSGRFSTFYVADLFFGIDVMRVQEVLRFQPLTRVPKSPDVIEGLMNLRGQIVTAIDMRRLLHLEERKDGAQPMNVVIRTDDGPVSLLVDEIGDVLMLETASYEQPPANLEPTAQKLIRGVYKLDGELMLVLDPERAVDVAVG